MISRVDICCHYGPALILETPRMGLRGLRGRGRVGGKPWEIQRTAGVSWIILSSWYHPRGWGCVCGVGMGVTTMAIALSVSLNLTASSRILFWTDSSVLHSCSQEVEFRFHEFPFSLWWVVFPHHACASGITRQSISHGRLQKQVKASADGGSRVYLFSMLLVRNVRTTQSHQTLKNFSLNDMSDHLPSSTDINRYSLGCYVTVAKTLALKYFVKP